MSDSRYERSFTDLMAGVAVVFLLLAVIFIREADRRRVDAEKAKEKVVSAVDGQKESVTRSLIALHQQLKVLDAEMDGGFVRLSALGDGGINSLEIEFKELQFASGKCQTPSAYVPQLRQGARGLVQTICRTIDDIRDAGARPSIILEGHTDDVAFTMASPECGVFFTSDPRLAFENNVRASSARAQSVFFTLRSEVADAGGIATCLDDNFVVSGRGQAAPLDPRAPGDDANRRLVIRVRGDLSL